MFSTSVLKWCLFGVDMNMGNPRGVFFEFPSKIFREGQPTQTLILMVGTDG